ncbi:MAG: vWA domain-containing protein, partial [Acidimicrobiia bacterium]
MRFAAPAGLFFLVLAVPVLLLHVLRPRRQTRLVSSTYLWRELAHPVSAASPWQRLRPSLLLLLQLLAVALLAASVARPVRPTAAPLSRHTVFILDASGSMAATDGRPDRLADARETARRLRAELPAGGLASLVVASADPRVALSASPDAGAFADALSSVRQAAGKVDFPGAFNLAESLETPDAPVGFVLLSDGGLDGAARRLLPPGTRYQKIGSRSENRTVSRLTVEVVPKGLRAIVSMRNTGGPASTQRLRLDVDGRTAERLEVRLGAGELVEREVDLPAGSEVEAFLEGEDLLPADNRAFATANARRQLRVLLSGPEDVYLERLLGAIPGLDLHLSDTSRTAEGFDLAIYDRVAVPPDPGGPFLAIAPPEGAPAIKVTGEVEQPAVTLVRSDAEVLQGLDLSTVGIAKAQRLDPVASDEVLVASEDTPLLVRGSREGRAFFYLGFALDNSNLPLQVTFPVLMDRILGSLAGTPPEPADLRTGERIPLPDRGEAATVVAPGGAEVRVSPGGPGPIATRPGFYRVRRPERPETVLAVNVAAGESVLAPVQTLPVRPRPPLPGERPPAGERSLLFPFILALLVVLAAELILSRRARGVPRRQWRVALAVRSILVACLVGALFGLALPRRGNEVTTIFAVDASDSMGPAGRENALAWVEEALADMPSGSGAGVTVFGGDTRVELTVRQRARLSAPLV